MILQIILVLIAIYGIAGFLFALAFVIKGVQRVDETARGAGIGFRIIIIPGVLVFWPFLWKKWNKAIRESAANRESAAIQKSFVPPASLRKRHRQSWILLGILLPLGIVTSWLVIPPQPVTKLPGAGTIDRLPEMARSVDSKDYRIHLRSDKERMHWQLEWENKTVLTTPSSVIYRVTDSAPQTAASPGAAFTPGKNEWIGRIEARGTYIFPLKGDSSAYKNLRLVLYDFIHNNIIDNINF